MRKNSFLIFFLVIVVSGFGQKINPYTFTYNGKKVYGKVKVVSSNQDFKVKIVNSSEDISIVKTEHSPSNKGEWQFVESGEDIKVKLVSSGEEFTVKFTTGRSEVRDSGPDSFEKNIDPSNCTFHGIPLKGKVKIVTSFPDFKVKEVDSFQDISIKVVDNFPDDCGEWQFVDSFPDFTIQLVESFPDVTIKFVNSFPGIK